MTEPDLHRNAERVQAALRAAGSQATVRQLSTSTGTAEEAAASLGVEVGRIAKTLVFAVDNRPVVVVVSGADRVDTKALAAHTGSTTAKRADVDTVRAATGYPIGGVSPIGIPAGVPVVVDRGLAAFDEVWVAAGTPYAVFPVTYDELVRITAATPGDVSVRA